MNKRKNIDVTKLGQDSPSKRSNKDQLTLNNVKEHNKMDEGMNFVISRSESSPEPCTFIDTSLDSILPPLLKEIYNCFIWNGEYQQYLKDKDNFYAGVGLFGVGVEEKIYKRRKFLEESLKRGFRLRPNPKPTKLFDGTVLNRPKRLKDQTNSVAVNSKPMLSYSKSYIYRNKNKLNLFTIGKDLFKRKPVKRSMRRSAIKKRPCSSNLNKTVKSIKVDIIDNDSKNETDNSSTDSSSDREAQSIALTKPKRQLKVPQLEFKYCYESNQKKPQKTPCKSILSKNSEPERIKSLKEIKSEPDLSKLSSEVKEIHCIDSDSVDSSVVEVSPPHLLIDEDADDDEAVKSLGSNADSDTIHLKLVTKKSNNSKRQWKPKQPTRALDLLDKLRLGLQCSIVKTETDIIIQNLNKDDLATLQSRLHGLATFKKIEVEHDKSGNETARATIDRRLLNIPIKSLSGTLVGSNSGGQDNGDEQESICSNKSQNNNNNSSGDKINNREDKNRGLKSYFDKLKRKNSQNIQRIVTVERKKPVVTGEVKEERLQNSSQNLLSWTRSKVRTAKKVRKLYTQTTNTPSILSRSYGSSNNNSNMNNNAQVGNNTIKSMVNNSFIRTSNIISLSSAGSTGVTSGTSSGLHDPSSHPSSSAIIHHSALSSMAFYPPKLTNPCGSTTTNHPQMFSLNNNNINVAISTTTTGSKSNSVDLTNECSISDENTTKTKNDSPSDIDQSTSISQSTSQENNKSDSINQSTELSHNTTNPSFSAAPKSTQVSSQNQYYNKNIHQPSTTSSAAASSVPTNKTPATAMSASQLLMMKKGHHNHNSNNNQNINNANNIGCQGNNNNNMLYNINSQIHAEYSSHNLTQSISNQILKPYKLLVVLPQYRHGFTQFIPCYRTTREYTMKAHSSAPNPMAVLSPPKLEIDDDNETDFELDSTKTTATTSASTAASISSTLSQQLIQNTPPITSTNLTSSLTTTTTSAISLSSGSSSPNVQPIKPLIQSSTRRTALHLSPMPTKSMTSSSSTGSSPNIAQIINAAPTTLVSLSSLSTTSCSIAPHIPMPKTTPLPITPLMTLVTANNSSNNSLVQSSSLSSSTNQIKHRKMTHNFHKSNNINFREVLCSTSSSTATTGSTTAVATLSLSSISSVVVNSPAVATIASSNAQISPRENKIHNTTIHNSPKISIRSISGLTTSPNCKSSMVLHSSPIKLLDTASNQSAVATPSSTNKSHSSVVLKSLLVGASNGSNGSGNSNSLSNTVGGTTSSNLTPIWASKYLGHHQNNCLHDSKIKWQVGGTIVSTVENTSDDIPTLTPNTIDHSDHKDNKK